MAETGRPSAARRAASAALQAPRWVRRVRTAIHVVRALVVTVKFLVVTAPIWLPACLLVIILIVVAALTIYLVLQGCEATGIGFILRRLGLCPEGS